VLLEFGRAELPHQEAPFVGQRFLGLGLRAADLAGLEGKMIIRIEGGKHYYDFDYQFSRTQ